MARKRSVCSKSAKEAPSRPDGFAWLPGCGRATAGHLADAGIATADDFLWWLPFRYEDRRNPVPLSTIQPDTTGCFRARVLAIKSRRGFRRGLTVTEALVGDDTGSVHVVWFNQPWLEKSLPAGTLVYLYGKVGLFSTRRGLRLQIDNPDVEKESAGEPGVHADRIVPVHHKAGGIGAKGLRTLFFRYFKASPALPEVLPASLLEAEDLPPRDQAFREAHFPAADVRMQDLVALRTPPQRRLIFEELLAFQWLQMEVRRDREALKGAVVTPTGETGDLLRRVLPFSLTAAQRRVFKEIVEDLKDVRPMYRLLQGDVGSGKTIVAFLALVAAAHVGFQGAFMAPTEILARQQYLKLERLLEGTGLGVCFLSASVKGAERKRVLSDLASGKAAIVVGTHSLFQKGVSYRRLGVVVIDEQHRFGVEQRSRLVAKGDSPNVLVMTATPIPRSLAMTLYGDLDISVIDELPPGRQKITTVVRDESARRKMEAFLRKETAEGRQVFFVFPLVEESEASDLKAATEAFERFREGAFRGVPSALLHGRMKAREKEEVMGRVRSGDVKLLVATSVVEVGVDLPEASVMVVEHAERFGLAQLHQLRGRVGRGGQKGFCVLMQSEGVAPESVERLKVMERTQDGFEIAEADLTFRGAGQLGGTRQWGGGDFKIADPLRDREALSRARTWAGALSDPAYEWQDKDKERFLKWVGKHRKYWSAYGRIG